MDGDRKIAVRVPADDLLVIDSLVADGKYTSPAEFVRAAVQEKLSAEVTPERREAAVRNGSERHDLDEFTDDDSGEILRTALEEGLAGRKDRQ